MYMPSGYFVACSTMKIEKAMMMLECRWIVPPEARALSQGEAKEIATHTSAAMPPNASAIGIGEVTGSPSSARARARAKIGHNATPAELTSCQTGVYIWEARLYWARFLRFDTWLSTMRSVCIAIGRAIICSSIGHATSKTWAPLTVRTRAASRNAWAATGRSLRLA